jgi:hypothetical protein
MVAGRPTPKVHPTRRIGADVSENTTARTRTALLSAKIPIALISGVSASLRTRQRAAEICNAYQQTLTGVANRILPIYCPEQNAGEAQIYRQRLEELDPYSASLSPSAPTPEQVADEAVVMERLEFPPPQAVVPPAQPAPATLVEVSDEGSPPSKEPLPEWLSAVAGQATSDKPDLSLSSDIGGEKIEGESQFPESQFTELESTMEPGMGEYEPISDTTKQEISESEEPAGAELPWIESPSLKPETEPSIPPPVEAPGDDIPDWLKVLGVSALAETELTEEEISPKEAMHSSLARRSSSEVNSHHAAGD